MIIYAGSRKILLEKMPPAYEAIAAAAGAKQSGHTMEIVGKYKMLKQLIEHQVFHNNFGMFHKDLWRLTRGDRQRAFKTIRATLLHYTSVVPTDEELDCILGELNDGVEIEWITLDGEEV